MVYCLLFLLTASGPYKATAQPGNRIKEQFRVIAFFTGKQDQAHISFDHEANRWLHALSLKHNFQFDSTTDWSLLNTENLKRYQLVIFLDTRPEDEDQRKAFENYMLTGGAWIGFHFSGFALTPSDVPQNWDWYHNNFLGSGQYVSNTWRPTSATLNIKKNTPFTKGLPLQLKTSPNEWYRWEHDLRNNPDIEILASIDSSSFPLGTGPKQHEIWHQGYYPVVWTNTKFHMIYFNMGHNDIDYENRTNKDLSLTFGNKFQDRFVENAILYMVGGKQQLRVVSR
ncbi:MAG: ThuA domain-containing protein [Flavitalea sp.]